MHLRDLTKLRQLTGCAGNAKQCLAAATAGQLTTDAQLAICRIFLKQPREPAGFVDFVRTVDQMALLAVPLPHWHYRIDTWTWPELLLAIKSAVSLQEWRIEAVAKVRLSAMPQCPDDILDYITHMTKYHRVDFLLWLMEQPRGWISHRQLLGITQTPLDWLDRIYDDRCEYNDDHWHMLIEYFDLARVLVDNWLPREIFESHIGKFMHVSYDGFLEEWNIRPALLFEDLPFFVMVKTRYVYYAQRRYMAGQILAIALCHGSELLRISAEQQPAARFLRILILLPLELQVYLAEIASAAHSRNVVFAKRALATPDDTQCRWALLFFVASKKLLRIAIAVPHFFLAEVKCVRLDIDGRWCHQRRALPDAEHPVACIIRQVLNNHPTVPHRAQRQDRLKLEWQAQRNAEIARNLRDPARLRNTSDRIDQRYFAPL